MLGKYADIFLKLADILLKHHVCFFVNFPTTSSYE